LRLRGALATATGGWVRPSLAVRPAELGGTWQPEPLRAARIALVERRADVAAVVVEPATPERAVDWAVQVLGEQRARLATIGGDAWRDLLEATAAAEADLLLAALTGTPVQSVTVPAGWPAAEGIAATATALGLERGS
jgi:hypothetical protein